MVVSHKVTKVVAFYQKIIASNNAINVITFTKSTVDTNALIRRCPMINRIPWYRDIVIKKKMCPSLGPSGRNAAS